MLNSEDESMIMEYPVFHSVRETVRLTGIAEHQIRKMVKAGEVPHIMSGRKILINVPAFLNVLEQRCKVFCMFSDSD